MSDLFSISELAHRQLFPAGEGAPIITLEEFIASAKLIYAQEVWILSKNEKNQEGVFNVPSILLSEAELDVKDNMIDISDLEVLRSLSNDSWLQNIGGMMCKCKYIKSNINQRQILCDDDSIPDDARLYFIVGNRIYLPRGAHAKKLFITYANRGLQVDDRLEIDDAIGSVIRTRLLELYAGKVGKEDVTNNENQSS